MKNIHSLLLIVLTAAFFAPAQTAENPNRVEKLTPLTKQDVIVYKYGFRGPPRVEYPGDIFSAPLRCHSDIDFELNIEFAKLGKRGRAILYFGIPTTELIYEPYQDKVRSQNDIFVRVRNDEKTLDAGFESEMIDTVEVPVLAAERERKIVLRKMIELPPGRYRADTTFRNRSAGCRGRSSKAFVVPEFENGNPIRSTLILGEPLEPMGPEPQAEFRHYPLRMLPLPSGVFRQGDRVAIGYLLAIPIEEYCATSACRNIPDDVEYRIEKNGKILMTFPQDWKHYKNAKDGRVITDFSTASLKPGKYTITATVKERKTGKVFSQSDVFDVIKK